MSVITTVVMTNASVGIRPERYRLPDAAHVGAVRLQVGDLARSLAFYTGVLGFRVLSQSDDTAVLGPEGEPIGLLELRERRGARALPRRGLLGLYHFAILVPSREALGRFVAHIAELCATSHLRFGRGPGECWLKSHTIQRQTGPGENPDECSRAIDSSSDDEPRPARCSVGNAC